MSQITKLINSIPLVPKEKKSLLAEDIITILEKEITPLILPQIFQLSQSTSIDDRHCAAKILHSMQDSFVIQFMPSESLTLNLTNTYLESSGKKYNKKSKDYEMQKQWIKSKLDIDIQNLVEEKDFSIKEIRKESIKAEDEEICVTDEMSFYKAIEYNLLSSEWSKRHSSFLLLLALFKKQNVDKTFFDTLFVRKIKVKKMFKYIPNKNLPSFCLEILKEDKFSDFINDQTVAPVRECASYLLADLFTLCPNKEEILACVFNLLNEEDWQEQLSGLLFLKYLDPEFVCQCKQTTPQNFSKFLANNSFCDKLNDLILCSQDEDIKYLSSSIKHKLNCPVPTEILHHALSSSHDISLSTASLINLLSTWDDLVIPLSASLFRHPLKEVRLSVLNLALRSILCINAPVTNPKDNPTKRKKSDISHVLTNIINNILVEEDELLASKNVEILLLIWHPSFTQQLYKQINQLFYKREEGCYDELFYSLNGVKQLGDTFIKNKLRLLIPLINQLEEIPCEKNLFCLLINFTNLYTCDKFLFTKHEIKKFKKKEVLHPQIREKYQEWLFCSVIEGDISFLREMKCFYREYYFECVISHSLEVWVNDIININNKGNNINNNIIIINNKDNIINKDSNIDTPISLIHFCYNNKIIELFSVLKRKNIIFFFDYFLNDLSLLSVIVEYVKKEERVFILCMEEIKKKKSDSLYAIISFYIKEDLFFSDLLVKDLLIHFDSELLNHCLSNLHPSYYILFTKKIISLSVYTLLSRILPYLCTTKEIESSLREKIKEEREKMIDLVSNTCKEYEVKCPMTVKLRKYQEEGVNWIAFLGKYGLSGILGDDMGLGKTLQVLTYVCSEIIKESGSKEKNKESGSKEKNKESDSKERNKERSKEKNKESGSKEECLTTEEYQCLILCPSTLITHWQSEIKQYFPFITHQIRVMSYEQIKRSNDSFNVSFLILDEGHILRNKETVVYNKVSQIKSHFKLLLSGTPVQNNSTDLVNLMNLMMKDYLNKGMDLTTLHKKTLPLVLRRLKSEVLEELPDKVISDVVIEMSDLQKRLYDCDESGVILGEEKGFKKIQRMLKICNDPFTYLKESEKKDWDNINNNISNNISNSNSSGRESTEISKWDGNAKLVALADLLRIIKEDSKVLIFCQHKSTIDSIEPLLREDPSLFSYVRLDGSTKEKDSVINHFKERSRILIMTTTVGGLGLNLTCADTVIFYEHDWNPFNDLQAMDRAHRIGQKRTVNVFRLIMKDTIEERIMNYQQFKVFLANKLVNYENQSVSSMNIGEVIEKFVEREEVSEEEEDFLY